MLQPSAGFLLLLLLSGAKGEDCTPLQSNTFTPLVVWFFLTLVAGSVGGLWLLGSRKRRQGTAVDAYRADGTSATGSITDLGEGVTRESWQINIKELRFEKLIGVGNVGEVYKGVFRGRDVAIKRLLGTWWRDADMVSRFREEI